MTGNLGDVDSPILNGQCKEGSFVYCEDPHANGSTYINGRPPASNPWSWGPYSATNLNDFESALTAAGYTVIRFGEKHQICPPFGAFGEDPSAALSNGITDDLIPPVEPNIDPAFVAINRCAALTVGKNDDRRDNLLSQMKSCLTELLELFQCPETKAADMRCESYNNPVTTGYRNWSDADALDDLVEEFGFPVPATKAIYVRIIEHDCDGVAQGSVGTVLGPYSVPQPNGADAMFTDLKAATQGTCIIAGPGSSSGPNGIGSNVAIEHVSGSNGTLVIQEGVSDNAGGINWLSSAQGFVTRDTGETGDFLISSNAGTYAGQTWDQLENSVSLVEADSCEKI